jgi:hypothetical protein
MTAPTPPTSQPLSRTPHHLPRHIVVSAVLVIALWFGLGGYERLTAPLDRWKLPSGDTVEILAENSEYSAGYQFRGRVTADHYLLIQFRSHQNDPSRDLRDVRGIMDVICVMADSMGYRRINIQPTRTSVFRLLRFGLDHWVTVDSGGRCDLEEKR